MNPSDSFGINTLGIPSTHLLKSIVKVLIVRIVGRYNNHSIEYEVYSNTEEEAIERIKETSHVKHTSLYVIGSTPIKTAKILKKIYTQKQTTIPF